MIVCEVKVKEGRDSAAAQTLEADEDEAFVVPVGEVGATIWPWRGDCRWSWRALASALSCVRTKYARF